MTRSALQNKPYTTCMLSCFTHVQLFATLWTVACQAPISMGFSRQEYQSGLPCPHPWDLPDPGIKPASPVSPTLQAKSSPLSHQGTLYQLASQYHIFSNRNRKQLSHVNLGKYIRSTLTKNFQMYKLGLEKAEKPEIKLPTFIRSQKKQRSSRKTSTSASLTT